MQIEGLKSSSEIAKQIITLSTGAVAFTVTFLEKFTKSLDGQPAHIPTSLYCTWVSFGLTIGAAILTLMAITGTLNALDKEANQWPLSDADKAVLTGDHQNIRTPAMAMFFLFMASIVLLLITGFSL